MVDEDNEVLYFTEACKSDFGNERNEEEPAPVPIKREKTPLKTSVVAIREGETLSEAEERLDEILIEDDLVKRIGEEGIPRAEREIIELELAEIQDTREREARNQKYARIRSEYEEHVKNGTLLPPPSNEHLANMSPQAESSSSTKKNQKKKTGDVIVMKGAGGVGVRADGRGRHPSVDWNTLPKEVQQNILNIIRLKPDMVVLFRYIVYNAPFSIKKAPKSTRRRGVRNDGRRPVINGKRTLPIDPMAAKRRSVAQRIE